MKKNPTYTICYRSDRQGSGPVMRQIVSLSGVRSLAKFLNNFKKNNPNYVILVAFVSDDDGKYLSNVKFLQAEYRAQRWLTGYKERLLANAVEQGFDIKWNHGLKAVSK
jgi:hypothetical protein